jgi:hypothetical protein
MSVASHTYSMMKAVETEEKGSLLSPNNGSEVPNDVTFGEILGFAL